MRMSRFTEGQIVGILQEYTAVALIPKGDRHTRPANEAT